jgi:hypothetical protein
VRWDVNSPPDGTDREIYTVANLDDFERMDLAPEGTPFYQTQWTNIAPRAGLTYQLSAHPTWGTIAKGGYGIFYDLGTGNAASAAAGYPYNRSRAYRTIEYPYVDPSLAEPLPVSLTPPYGSLTVFDPEIELPFTHQWNVGIDQTLGARQSLSVAYVGALGRRLLRQETIVNPNPRFTSVAVTRNASESTYHSLQLQFQRRLSAGLQVLASYTLADSTDDVSNDSLSGPPVGRFDIAVDRGASDFDIRHSFSSAISYDFPAPGGRVGRVLAGGWSMDVMIRARSAAPFSVTVTRDLGFGSFAVRPDIVPGVPVWIDDPIAPGGRRLNREAFAVPLELRQGNLPRNGLRGFAARQLDLAIRREFQVYGRVRFQFRGELFNLFNTPNFGPPTGNLTSALFGGATQMLGRSLGTGGAYAGFNPLYQIGGPRSGQIALKLLF